jgi:hypothetical protein
LETGTRYAFFIPACDGPLFGDCRYNLYRLVPDDRLSMRSLAKKIWQDGKTVILPLAIRDVYADELLSLMDFELGRLGSTMEAGTRYSH